MTGVLERIRAHGSGDPWGWRFWCPGCGETHDIPVESKRGAQWTFNGDEQRPTFAPSILVRWRKPGEGERICHSFVRDGRIEYLGDCTHHLAGQVVALMPIPEGAQ